MSVKGLFFNSSSSKLDIIYILFIKFGLSLSCLTLTNCLSTLLTALAVYNSQKEYRIFLKKKPSSLSNNFSSSRILKLYTQHAPG